MQCTCEHMDHFDEPFRDHKYGEQMGNGSQTIGAITYCLHCQRAGHGHFASAEQLGIKRPNEFNVGTILWIMKNEINELRDILDGLITGQMTIDQAEKALWIMDTDSASN